MRATTPCFKPMTLTVRSLLLDVWGRNSSSVMSSRLSESVISFF